MSIDEDMSWIEPQLGSGWLRRNLQKRVLSSVSGNKTLLLRNVNHIFGL